MPIEENPYIKTYGATAAGFNVSVSRIGEKFRVSAICVACARGKKKLPPMDAADTNLATAIAFLMYQQFTHTQDYHK